MLPRGSDADDCGSTQMWSGNIRVLLFLAPLFSFRGSVTNEVGRCVGSSLPRGSVVVAEVPRFIGSSKSYRASFENLSGDSVSLFLTCVVCQGGQPWPVVSSINPIILMS